jgi:putative heme iron utilization protein
MQRSPEFDPIRTARHLLREGRSGTLASISPGGAPYASLVNVATMPDALPILLLSRLALHTANISADPRVSLLLAQRHAGDPLEAARVSIAGTISVVADSVARRRYLARHPGAAAYVGFTDFAFWKIEMTGAHLVAGFGRIHDIAAEELVTNVADAAPVLEAEESAVAHMNEDHADAVELYATGLLGAEPGPWRVIAIDPEGCDLILGDTVRRLDFPQRVTTSAALRKTLADLARQARAGPDRG